MFRHLRLAFSGQGLWSKAQVSGVGFRFQGLGFRVLGSGLTGKGEGFRVKG